MAIGAPGSANKAAAVLGASSGNHVAVLMAAAIVLHAPVFFGPHLGEQDTARLVIDALLWQKGGVRQVALSDYQYFISPGYIWLIRTLLPLCEMLRIEIGYVLNGLNLVASAVVVLPLHRLFRGFLSPSASFYALFVLLFVPTFWQAGLYGFPHLPAMVCMLTALALLDRPTGPERVTARAAWRRNGTVFACLTAAIVLKADIYLSVVAAPILFFRHGRITLSGLLRLGALVAAPVAVLVALWLAVIQDVPNPFQFAAGWNQQYAPNAQRLMSLPAISSWLFSFGLLTLPVVAGGVVRTTLRGRPLAAVVVSVWLAVPLLFWSTRPLDSARHHFQAGVPAGLGVGLALDALPAGMLVRGLAAASVIAVNYWAFPPSDVTAYPSGNLLASARQVRNRVASYDEFADRFAAIDSPCKLVVGTNTNPYVDVAVLRDATRVTRVRREQRFGFDVREYVIELPSGRMSASSSAVVPEAELDRAVEAFRAAGYELYSLQYSLGGNGAGGSGARDVPGCPPRVLP